MLCHQDSRRWPSTGRFNADEIDELPEEKEYLVLPSPLTAPDSTIAYSHCDFRSNG
jgi:hypothetical protein